jgi:protein O-GlcNAc transferase
MTNSTRTIFDSRSAKLVRKGSYAAALPLLRRATRVPNPSPENHILLARCHFGLGDIHEAVTELRRASKSSDLELSRAALGKIAVCIPGDPTVGSAEILKARLLWARQEARVESPRLSPSPAGQRTPRKLRIGYVSAFFSCRNWMKPVWGMLDAHDREAFEIHLFLDRGLPDQRHGYVPHRSDRVHPIDGLSNEAAAKLVATARIDILVDLNAYSYPRRLGLFFHKPAPIQLGWFNTFATSGIDAFDYVVADKATVTAGEKAFYLEKILYVSGSYLAFTVPHRVPTVVAPPRSRSGRITFGCLAPQYKINRDVIATFAAILRAAPKARLILKNTCLGNPSNRAAIRARFLRHGISEGQLICEGPARHFAFIKTYGRIDVALDTFPYSGGTTTMEALWQGVPVLTVYGDRWISRISCSLLLAAGLDDWVRPSRPSLIRRAIAIASSKAVPAQLSALRSGLRKRLLASPACDVGGLCRQLETHYRAIASTRNRPSKSARR